MADPVKHADCVYCLYSVAGEPDGVNPINPATLSVRMLHSIYHRLLENAQAQVPTNDSGTGGAHE
jgi:hypothetical protein